MNVHHPAAHLDSDATAASTTLRSAPEASSASALSSASSVAATVARLRAAGCVFAEDEAALLLAAAPGPAELEDLLARRTAGVPLEHVLGWAEFCGLRIAVGPGAFVPRRRSEFLVGQARAVARAVSGAFSQAAAPATARTGTGPLIVDLCCGTGAIAAALAADVPGAEIHAADIDPAQTYWARRNLADAPVAVHVHEGDLFHALPDRLRGHIDILVANAPYVPTAGLATLPPEARDHEPATALDGGRDGVSLHRRITADAAKWLARDGRLLIETSERQSPLTVAAFQDGGLVPEVVRCEDLDATVVIGSRSGSRGSEKP
jgi:release factor glutamine methyltransferase